jgi:hypothetical protein
MGTDYLMEYWYTFHSNFFLIYQSNCGDYVFGNAFMGIMEASLVVMISAEIPP